MDFLGFKFDMKIFDADIFFLCYWKQLHGFQMFWGNFYNFQMFSFMS